MRRLALILSVVSGVVLILGLVEYLTNFHWAQGDQNAFFGNQKILLNDGATALIAGGLLLIGSAILWFLALRKGHGDQHQT
jgi:hypothetical protein